MDQNNPTDADQLCNDGSSAGEIFLLKQKEERRRGSFWGKAL